jgi:hypothetical protein
VPSRGYLGVADPALTDGWLNSIMPVADGSIAVDPPADPAISTCASCVAGAMTEGLLATAQAYWLRDAALDPGLAFSPPASPYVLYEVQMPRRSAGAAAGAAPIGGHVFAAASGDSRATSYEILHDLGLRNVGNTAGDHGEAWPFCEGGLALTCVGAPDTSLNSAGAVGTRPLAFDTSPVRGDETSWNTARDALGQAVVKDPLAHLPYAGLEPAAQCSASGPMQYHDIMFTGNSSGTCSDLGAWISTINYCRVFFTLSGLPTPKGAAAADFCKQTQGMLTAAQIASLASAAHVAPGPDASPAAPTAQHTSSGGEMPATGYVEASGLFAPGPAASAKTVPTIGNAGPLSLLPPFVSSRSIAPNPPATSGLVGVLVSGTGSILAVQNVALREISDRNSPDWLSFSFELPLKPNAQELLLVRTAKGHNTVLAVITTPRSPVISLVPSNTGSAISPGTPFTLAWNAGVKTADHQLYDVAMSCDNGVTYQSLAVALKVPALAIEPSSLCGGSLLFRVTASSGFESIAGTAGPYRSPMRPPSLKVLAPADGSIIPPVVQVALSGQAIDPGAGILGGTQLSWTSDRDGVLGNGATLVTSSLSLGTHHITLQAVAPDGLSARRTITLTVMRLHLPATTAGGITP